MLYSLLFSPGLFARIRLRPTLVYFLFLCLELRHFSTPVWTGDRLFSLTRGGLLVAKAAEFKANTILSLR